MRKNKSFAASLEKRGERWQMKKLDTPARGRVLKKRMGVFHMAHGDGWIEYDGVVVSLLTLSLTAG